MAADKEQELLAANSRLHVLRGSGSRTAGSGTSLPTRWFAEPGGAHPRRQRACRQAGVEFTCAAQLTTCCQTRSPLNSAGNFLLAGAAASFSWWPRTLGGAICGPQGQARPQVRAVQKLVSPWKSNLPARAISHPQTGAHLHRQRASREAIVSPHTHTHADTLERLRRENAPKRTENATS